MNGAVPAAMPGAGLGELARAELRLVVRSGGFLLLAALVAVCAVLTQVTLRYAAPMVLSLGPTAYSYLRDLLDALLPIVVPPLVCAAALREHRLEMGDLLLSKPPSSERLYWGKLVGVSAAVALLLPVAALAALAAQAALFREVTVYAVLLAALRAAPPLLFSTLLSFALATFARSALVAGFAMALPIAVAAGSSYLIPVLQFTLTPYHLTWALLGLACAAGVAAWWQAGRQPERTLLRRVAPAAAALALALVAGASATAKWRGWTLDADPAMQRLGDRKLQNGPLPDTPMRTVDGGTLRLGAWTGKPLTVVLWSTDGADGASEAAALARACREGGEGRVELVTACVTEDPLRAGDVAAIAGLDGPVLWNPPPRFEMATGLAAALGIEQAPQRAIAAFLRGKDPVVGPSTVTEPPMQAGGAPPRRQWAHRLTQLGTAAFRRLAEEKH
ncbi:MAG: hypothetical protein ACK47B_01960 [Armatimonadota bacterium]